MGIFSKLKQTFSGKSEQTSSVDIAGKFAPEEPQPLDVQFVGQFTAGGGNFMYCTSEAEAHAVIEHYASEMKLTGLFISSPELASVKNAVRVPTSFENDGQYNAVLSSCEALIAFNGGIMIHSHHTGGRRLGDLPKNHVIIANTSQIVPNLRDGMTAINQKYRDNRPSNISVIRAPHDQAVELAAADPNKGRTVMLILIEDEV
ncbi:MAG: hypothetical protein RL754_91 [Bacteroidota bacterium]|jgi:L-lactate dehydrogenase complex protein LldG